MKSSTTNHFGGIKTTPYTLRGDHVYVHVYVATKIPPRPPLAINNDGVP